MLPRVQKGDARGLEVGCIAGCDRHAVDERRRSNQSIPIRAAIWNMERGTPHGNLNIDRQNAPGIRGQDLAIEPGAEHSALYGISSLGEQRTHL